MPWWLVLLGLLVAALLGWFVLIWLLGEADQGGTRAQLRIDAIRTGLTVVAGTGGAVALLFAARRQWVSERSQRHQERVAAAEREHRERVQAHVEAVATAEQRHQEERDRSVERDATERRVTELYAKAVDQLGSERPTVRMGGLYALERLAQDNARHRQTIVDVLCAYLRMGDAADADDPREAQVRAAAQRLLARHLRPDDAAAHWPGMRLDLAAARLADFDVSGCTIEQADLGGAIFTGTTRFVGTVVAGPLALAGAAFETAEFDGVCWLADLLAEDVTASGPVSFERAAFGGAVSFNRARLAGPVTFARATFRQAASFDRARFGGETSFSRAVFERGASLEHAVFAEAVRFRGTRFADMAMFRWTVFSGDAAFTDAHFANAVHFARAEFHGSAIFDGATSRRRILFDRTRAAAAAPHLWPPGAEVRARDDGWLVVGADEPPQGAASGVAPGAALPGEPDGDG